MVMKKCFDAKKPFMVLFCNTPWGERRVVVPFNNEKKMFEMVKEPFALVEAGSFFLASKLEPSAIKGQPPISKDFGGIYNNDVYIRSNSIVEISVAQCHDQIYEGMKKTFEELCEIEKSEKES